MLTTVAKTKNIRIVKAPATKHSPGVEKQKSYGSISIALFHNVAFLLLPSKTCINQSTFRLWHLTSGLASYMLSSELSMMPILTFEEINKIGVWFVHQLLQWQVTAP